MKPIQPILLLFLAAGAVLYFIRLRKKTLDRAIVLLFILAGAVLVAAPDLSSAIAQLVGVGRGADLVLYLGLLGLSFVCLLLYARLRDMEASLSELVRSIAVQNARIPDNDVPESELPED